jgi:hypothetical protein
VEEKIVWQGIYTDMKDFKIFSRTSVPINCPQRGTNLYLNYRFFKHCSAQIFEMIDKLFK